LHLTVAATILSGMTVANRIRKPIAEGAAAARPTRTELLRRQLADSIITGRLAPGARLDEQEIAKAYGLSRTPVREALRQLAASGLAELRPHRGAIVAALTAEGVAQAFELMADLESLCARYAAQRMTVTERRDLEALHLRLKEIVRTGDPDLYADLNVQFHQAIYRGSHNAALQDATLTVRQRVAPYRRGQFRLLGRLAESLAEHDRVVTAILQGNGEVAAREMHAHVAIVRQASAEYAAAADRPNPAR